MSYVPHSTHLSGHQTYMLHEGLWALLLRQDDSMGSLVGAAGPICWFARLFSGWRPLASRWQSQVTGQLAAKPWLLTGLVLTVGQSLVPGWIDGCRTRVPGYSVGLLVGRFSSIPQLILACW